jgi:DMSO/TMAO reductase YedYZ molybdopterin-dependent catalytic subunit
MYRRNLIAAALAGFGLFALLALAQSESVSAVLTVSGDVPSPLHLKADDLAGMPRQTVFLQEEGGTRVPYEGVLLREVLARAGAPLGKELRGKALASYVLAKAHDGYRVVFGLAEVDASYANETILVADKREGKPLSGQQGPFRLVCPNDKAGARSVRMLETLELVRLK